MPRFLPDQVIAVIGHVKIARRAVHRNAQRMGKSRGGSPSGVVGSARITPAVPAKVVTVPGGCDFADGVVAVVCHVQVGGAVQRNARRLVEGGGGAGAIGTACDSGHARQGGGNAGGIDDPDDVVARIGHINIA